MHDNKSRDGGVSIRSLDTYLLKQLRPRVLGRDGLYLAAKS